jgi:ABC-type Fe3+/spermidine/putrescine transport system ATPase subunit
MSELTLEQISKSYGSVQVLREVSLAIAEGEFVAILGPSGCGKTTTLNVVAGFTEPDAGQVLLAGVDITRQRPERRDTALVFQNYALFPHMTVRKNIQYGLRARRIGGGEARARLDRVSKLLGIAGLEDRYPGQLSGGQQQRVAVARALVVQPAVLLLDEPLSNLDEKLRKSVRAELRSIQRELRQTAIIVTHDHEEALSLADRLVVMDAGRVVQVGTPDEVFSRPRTRFVADFMGITNIFAGTRSGGRFMTEGGTSLPLPADLPDAPYVALRPSALRLTTAPASGGAGLGGVITDRTYLGDTVQYRIAVGGQAQAESVSVQASSERASAFAIGDRVGIEIPAGAVLPLQPDDHE